VLGFSNGAHGLRHGYVQERMKMEAETEMEAVEGFRKKNTILQAELVKARAKIQRLEKKLALKPILKE
jgi:hypothetical protein